MCVYLRFPSNFSSLCGSGAEKSKKRKIQPGLSHNIVVCVYRMRKFRRVSRSSCLQSEADGVEVEIPRHGPEHRWPVPVQSCCAHNESSQIDGENNGGSLQ